MYYWKLATSAGIQKFIKTKVDKELDALKKVNPFVFDSSVTQEVHQMKDFLNKHLKSPFFLPTHVVITAKDQPTLIWKDKYINVEVKFHRSGDMHVFYNKRNIAIVYKTRIPFDVLTSVPRLKKQKE